MWVLLSFSQPHVVPNLYDNLSSAEHKRMYWQPILMTTHFHFMDTQKERHFLISTAITPVFSVTWSFKNPIFSHQWKIRSCINCKKKIHKKPLQQYNSNTTTELKSSEVSFNPINTLRCNIVPFMFVRLTERSPQQRQFLLTWKRGLLNINYIMNDVNELCWINGCIAYPASSLL